MTGLNWICHRRVLGGDVMMGCSVLKKLELTAGELLRRKAVRDRVRSFE